MKTMFFAAAAAAGALIALPVSVVPLRAASIHVAQVDVDVVAPGNPKKGVVIEEHRRPGVVIEGTEGRGPRDCVTRSESVTRGNGATVTQSERNCR